MPEFFICVCGVCDEARMQERIEENRWRLCRIIKIVAKRHLHSNLNSQISILLSYSALASGVKCCLPPSVHRLPCVTSYDKQSAHARSTVYGPRSTVSGEMDAPIASSQQPVASSRERLSIKKEKHKSVPLFFFLFYQIFSFICASILIL